MRLPALRNTALLLPHDLSEASAQAVADLLREGQARNTLASYKSALRYWAGWFAVRYGRPIQLPIPVAAVLQFIVDHADRQESEHLTHELSDALDDSLVKSGIKGKKGSLSLNTIEHRLQC